MVREERSCYLDHVSLVDVTQKNRGICLPRLSSSTFQACGHRFRNQCREVRCLEFSPGLISFPHSITEFRCALAEHCTSLFSPPFQLMSVSMASVNISGQF